MKVRVQDIKEGRDGLYWVKGEKGLFLIKDFGGKVGDEIEVNKYVEKQTKSGVKYYYVNQFTYLTTKAQNIEKNLEENSKKAGIKVEKEEKKEVDYKEAVKVISDVEKTVNQILVDRQEMVRLAILNAIYGGTMLMVGGTGVGKTMTSELVASAFSKNVFYTQLNHFKELDDVIGQLDLKKFRDDGVAIRKVERFINADFHIYDEFYNSTGRLRGALNDYLVLRRLTVDEVGIIKGKTRAIFLTSNHIDNLRDPRVIAEGGGAIADRINLIYTVPELDEEGYLKILRARSENRKVEYSFKEPFGSINHLNAIKEKALEMKTPFWLEKKLSQFASLIASTFPEIRISPRKLISINELALVHAVMEGRDKVLEKDLRTILPHTLFLNQNDKRVKEEVDKIVSMVLNLETNPLVKVLINAKEAMDNNIPAKDWYIKEASNLINKDNIKLLQDLLDNKDKVKSVEIDYTTYIVGGEKEKEELFKYINTGVNSISEKDVEKQVDEALKMSEKELEEMLGLDSNGGIKL